MRACLPKWHEGAIIGAEVALLLALERHRAKQARLDPSSADSLDRFIRTLPVALVGPDTGSRHLDFSVKWWHRLSALHFAVAVVTHDKNVVRES